MNLLSLIIERLNQRVATYNLFDQIYGLSELSQNGNEKAWINYIGEGQAQVVSDYDGANGTLFWAKRGNVSINKTDQFATVSCRPMYITVFPLTAYLIVRKSSLPCDSSEAADYVANIFHKAVSGYDKDFKAAIKVAQYEVIPTAYNDSVPSLPLSYEWVTLTVDFNIQIVSTSEGCFEDCENITFIDTQIYINGELFTTVPYGSTEDIIVNYITAGQVPTTFVDGIVIVPDPEGGGAGNAVLNDGDGNFISTTVIPADSNTPVVAPNGAVTVKNSANTTVDSGDVLSNGSAQFDAPDATAVLKDSAGTIITANPIPSNASEDMIAPDGSITVNSTAFDVVKSNGSFNVPVKYVNGTLVGSKVGANWEIPDPVVDPKILITTVTFGSGVTLDFTITIDADSAGTYTSATFSGGMASATYLKNGGAATLPFTLIATDTLTITPNATGVIKLTGTYP